MMMFTRRAFLKSFGLGMSPLRTDSVCTLKEKTRLLLFSVYVMPMKLAAKKRLTPRYNITLDARLHSLALQRTEALMLPSLSAYLSYLVRKDCTISNIFPESEVPPEFGTKLAKVKRA